jgi:predicted PhzF superfamily epimerase YddE/YHI9
MTRLPIYQIDAFTDHLFRGNPAAVIPLTEWLPEATMRAISTENNMPATAFFCRDGDAYGIRWFTPEAELPLCGHGTLASGYVVLRLLEPSLPHVTFRTRSGTELGIVRDGEALAMSLPSDPAASCEMPVGLVEALGAAPRATLAAQRTLAVFDDPRDVIGLAPNFAALRRLGRGVIVTAPGDKGYDCVSRVFVPAPGIDEDAVTGSAHCTIVPYWIGRLGKPKLKAHQASPRDGELACSLHGERVTLAGHARLYLEGTISI